MKERLETPFEHNGTIYPTGAKIPTFTADLTPIPLKSLELKEYMYDKDTNSLLKETGDILFEIPKKFNAPIDINRPMPVIEVKAGDYQIYWLVSKEEIESKSIPLTIDDFLNIDKDLDLKNLDFNHETKTAIVVSD